MKERLFKLRRGLRRDDWEYFVDQEIAKVMIVLTATLLREEMTGNVLTAMWLEEQKIKEGFIRLLGY